MRTNAGFTLIELIASLAVLAATLTMAIPAMHLLRESSQAVSAMHQLTAALASARIEAVRRNQPVSVCPSSDGMRCRGDHLWDDGWLVFRDPDRAGQPHDAAAILQTFPAIGSHVRLRATVGRPLVRFTPDGWSAGSNLSLRLCVGRAEPALFGAVVVNNAGRPRSERPSAPRPCPFGP